MLFYLSNVANNKFGREGVNTSFSFLTKCIAFSLLNNAEIFPTVNISFVNLRRQIYLSINQSQEM